MFVLTGARADSTREENQTNIVGLEQRTVLVALFCYYIDGSRVHAKGETRCSAGIKCTAQAEMGI